MLLGRTIEEVQSEVDLVERTLDTIQSALRVTAPGFIDPLALYCPFEVAGRLSLARCFDQVGPVRSYKLLSNVVVRPVDYVKLSTHKPIPEPTRAAAGALNKSVDRRRIGHDQVRRYVQARFGDLIGQQQPLALRAALAKALCCLGFGLSALGARHPVVQDGDSVPIKLAANQSIIRLLNALDRIGEVDPLCAFRSQLLVKAGVSRVSSCLPSQQA